MGVQHVAQSLALLMAASLLGGCPDSGTPNPTATEEYPGFPALVVTPDPVYFNDVLIYGAHTDTQTVTISNQGEGILYVDDILVSDDGDGDPSTTIFEPDAPSAQTLIPGESVSFDIVFDPPFGIEYRGVLIVTSNDENTPIAEITLIGSGTRGTDADGDDVTIEEGDCNDNDPTIYPGAPELCDGKDNDCDGETDEGFDTDGDGYTTCDLPIPDCDDTNPAVNPGAAEVCDGADNDCDTVVDEGFDADSDGTADCIDNDGDGQTEDEGDCDDGDATVYDGAPELCDGKDNDCDGTVDNDPDDDGDGTPDCIDNDGDGQAEVDGDCDDADPTVYDGAPELCDFKDNDCDGDIDEGTDLDSDGDTFTACEGDCDDGAADTYPGATETCDGDDQDCDGTVDEGFDVDGDGFTTCAGDCADGDPGVNPGATEVCDGDDEDCDGHTDEGFDADGDGTSDCIDNDGDGDSEDDGDCDDTDATVHPGAPEACNGVDDDCDGAVDEGATSTWYTDGDSDGYGNSNSTTSSCDQPPGTSGQGGDCNDNNAQIHPGAVEVCNDRDDNCNGQVDEGFDADGDGYATCEGDCDDNDPAENPGTPERCNGLDDNCNSQVDEGFDVTGDGQPDCELSDDDGDGYSESQYDCDDDDASIYPITVDTNYTAGGANGSTAKPFRKIQVGLDQSQPCPHVWVKPGTYAENVVFPIWIVGLHSTDGPAVTTINGGGAGSTVTISGASHTGSVIEDFTIRGGSGTNVGGRTYGGGLYINVSNPTVRDNIITANGVTGSGAGAYVGSGANPTFTGNTFRANTATQTTAFGGGGGLAIDGARATIQDNDFEDNVHTSGGGLAVMNTGASQVTIDTGNIFDGNTARYVSATGGQGGGVYVDQSTVTFTGNFVRYNVSEYRGGGVYYDESSAQVPDLTFSDNVFRGNVAGLDGVVDPFNRGGGVYIHRGDPTFRGNTFRDNVCHGFGGGMYLRSRWDGLVEDNDFLGNQADIHGGGLYTTQTDGVVSGNLFDGNDADNLGGGILCYDDCLTLFEDNDVTNNTSNDGGGMCSIEASPTIRDNRFTGNEAVLTGGAIIVIEGEALVEENTVDGNRAGVSRVGRGGGIYLTETTSEVRHNLVIRNVANGSTAAGGGIRVENATDEGGDSDPLIVNNIIADNTAYRGGGISFEIRTDGVVLNNTLTGNIGTDGVSGQGGGIYVGKDAVPDLRNNIIAFSRAGGGIHFYKNADTPSDQFPTVDYNQLYNNIGDDYNGEDLAVGAHEQIGDPRFTAFSNDGNPLNDTLTLQGASPAKNTGDPASQYNDPDGSRNDRGAYGGPDPY